MKYTKYILIVAAAIAVLVATSWVLRDTLVRRISNPLLQEYDIAVTDVSLDALATSDATIGHLELEHAKGTTIAIEDLTLPIGADPSGSKSYRAGKVSIITSTRTDTEPFELARLVDQVLSLPGAIGATEVVIAELNLPPYAAVHDIRWRFNNERQDLSARIAGIAMSATLTKPDSGDVVLEFSLPDFDTTANAHTVSAHMTHDANGIRIVGAASLQLPAWEPVGKLAGIVPAEIAIKSGVAKLEFDADMPYDTNVSPAVIAVLEPIAPLQFTWSGAADEITTIDLEAAGPIKVAASFPDVDWSLQQKQVSLLVSYGEWHKIPVSVSQLACRSDPVCTMHTRVEMGDAELPIGSVDRLEFASELDVAFPDEGFRANVRPGASLLIIEFAAAGTTVGRIDAELADSATMDFPDAGWSFAAGSLDARVEAVSLPGGVGVSMPFFLDNVQASELDEVLSLKLGVFTPSAAATVRERTIALPGLRGDVSMLGAKTIVSLQTVGLYEEGKIDLQHDIDSGYGRLSIDGATASFAEKKLSDRVSAGPGDWDLVAGNASVDVEADWTSSSGDTTIVGKTTARVSELSGHFGETAFAGLSTNLDVAYNGATGFSSQPSAISVALVESGLPIENISADYALDINSLAIDVENLHMSAFGGVVRADPFSFHTARETNTLVLHAESVELSKLLSLKEFETIDVSGSVGARLPLTIEGETVTIVGGTLSGEPPGGVIRYRPDEMPADDDTSVLALATRALSNFEFESLASDVNLDKEGDLVLQLKLTGRNPMMDEDRPVVLNLGVENNIPQMLKSLRAARAVEDILERRLTE